MDNKYLHMCPDYGDALFWDIDGVCCGGTDYLFLDNDTEIDLYSIDGLDEWYNQWQTESLHLKHNWSEAEWLAWRERGMEMAKKVKALLPITIDLYYMWDTDTLWEVKPEDSDDGGLMKCGVPILVK